MARPTNITLCSFCGKSHAEVKKLIAGPGVYICDNCVVLCKQVLDKELSTQARKHKPRINIAKPAEIPQPPPGLRQRNLDVPTAAFTRLACLGHHRAERHEVTGGMVQHLRRRAENSDRPANLKSFEPGR